MKNLTLENLKERRNKLAMKISKLMRSPDYYTNPERYKEVAALTGLETFYVFKIEEMEKKIEELRPTHYDEYMM